MVLHDGIVLRENEPKTTKPEIKTPPSREAAKETPKYDFSPHDICSKKTKRQICFAYGEIRRRPQNISVTSRRIYMRHRTDGKRR